MVETKCRICYLHDKTIMQSTMRYSLSWRLFSSYTFAFNETYKLGYSTYIITYSILFLTFHTRFWLTHLQQHNIMVFHSSTIQKTSIGKLQQYMYLSTSPRKATPLVLFNRWETVVILHVIRLPLMCTLGDPPEQNEWHRIKNKLYFYLKCTDF